MFRRLKGLRYLPYEVKEFCLRLRDYLPLLWSDRDWDWIFIVRLLKLKLERTSAALAKGHLVCSPKRAVEIKRLAYLLDRIIKDEYNDYYYAQVEKKYGDLEMKSLPTDNPRLAELVMDRPGARRGTPEYLEEHKRAMRAFKHAEYMRQQDINYVFDQMKRKLQMWWD